ncbi:MAG TPA: hypothetical protein PKK48_07225, partial [Phycisphaerae bacterium]|nr:hypothetical protein [Phycisphaerae bacterium]
MNKTKEKARLCIGLLFSISYKTGFSETIFRTYPKNMGVAEIEQFCGPARKKNGSILLKKTYSAVF